MGIRYFLQRETPKKVINLGVKTGNGSFYPTMTFEVIEILVKEAHFSIYDQDGNKHSFNNFKDTVNNTYSSSPPLISLNTSF